MGSWANIQWVVTLLTAVAWNQMMFQIPSNLSHSIFNQIIQIKREYRVHVHSPAPGKSGIPSSQPSPPEQDKVPQHLQVPVAHSAYVFADWVYIVQHSHSNDSTPPRCMDELKSSSKHIANS